MSLYCCWILVTGYWLLVAGCWSLVAGHWLLVAGRWLLVAGRWLLVAGCWLLVAGRWSLVTGCWLLVVGRWSLVTGCWSLVTGCWSMVTGYSSLVTSSKFRYQISDIRFQSSFYNPISSLIPLIAIIAISANSGKGIPIFSHSRIVSRFTEAAKAFAFMRFTTDFGLTLASFLSG